MCILVLGLELGARWRMLLVANRDEAHARASAPLGPWPDSPDLIGGRDLVSGGTWLGVSGQGRLCAVTNRRGFGLPDPAAPSRGRLVLDILRGADAAAQNLDPYNPVSLVVVDGRGGLFRSNRPAIQSVALGPGLHGLSNGPLEEPSAKVAQLKQATAAWVAAGAAELEPLFTALRDESLAADAMPAAAVFMRHPDYGTRCSTVVAVDHAGAGVMMERRFDAGGMAVGDTRLAFAWPSSPAAPA